MNARKTVALLLALTSGCEESRPEAEETAARTPEQSEPQLARARPAEVVELLAKLPDCDVRQRGILLDVGSAAVDSQREYTVGPFEDVVNEERAGSTYGKVMERRLAYDFWLENDARDLVISLRASGIAARRASVYVDDRRLGSVKLSEGDHEVAALPPIAELAAGRHTVVLRFAGTPRTEDEPYASVDWIRVGPKDEDPERYAAPTLRRIVTDVVVNEQAKRSIVLRGPSTVRCAVYVVPGSEMRLGLGYWGDGKGVAQIRVVEDGEEPVVLTERRVSGGHGRAWTELRFSLEPFADRLVGLEFRALETKGTGRIAFGEPVISVADRGDKPVPRARVVVVVVAAGLDRRALPPWGPVGELAALGELGRTAVAFDSYRVPTTVTTGVMASLLTATTPRQHTVEDPLARLPNEIVVLSELAKEASGRAAFFTGVPMSFGAFGFDRGWNKFATYSPVHDIAATAPISEAAAWLRAQLADEDEQHPVFLVIHARGGHPPWDLTHDEASLLPPEDYGGRIEPRGGALALAEVRVHPKQRLTAHEWRRLRALELAALQKQVSALGHLLDVVDRSGVSSLVVFAGDVGTGDPPHLPFSPTPKLTEDFLIVPLLVRFPGNALAGKRVKTSVTTWDVSHTILAALGLSPPKGAQGLDLFRVAQGYQPPGGRSHTATLGSAFSTRWGSWLLRGEVRRVPSLCQVEIDPACANDVLKQNPIAAAALWRSTYSAEARERSIGGPRYTRESVALDAETLAAQKVFGYGN